VLLHQTRRPSDATRRFWEANTQEWQRLMATPRLGWWARAFDATPLRRTIEEAGGRMQIVDVAVSRDPKTVDQEIERLRRRTDSWTWELPAAAFDAALSEYERWLRAALPAGSWTDESTIELEVWRWT
jgi:hypothetical protein